MTIVTDYKQCRQCGFERADYELDCSTSEERVDCRKCGHSEAMARVEDDGKVTWKHVVREGSGVLAYDSGHAFVAGPSIMVPSGDPAWELWSAASALAVTG